MGARFDALPRQQYFAVDGLSVSDKHNDLNLTVLIAEDSEETRHVLRVTFEDKGYRVVMAADGQEAVETAIRVRPDLILMDLHLPRLDGLAATAQIRKQEELTHIPILAVTLFDTYGIKEAAYEAGCSGYLTKPLDLDHLGKLLRSILH